MGDLLNDWNKATKTFDGATKAPKPRPGAKFTKLYDSKCDEIADLLKTLEAAYDASTDLDAVMDAYKEYAAAAMEMTIALRRLADRDDSDYKDPLKKLTDALEDIRKDGKKLTAAAMAKDSQDRAVASGKSDWKSEFTPDLVKKVAKVTLDSSEYKKFASAFTKFLSDWDLGSDGKLPVYIWSELIKGLAKSGYIDSKIPKVSGDPEQFILGEIDSASGKVIREALLADAMEGLQPFIDHARRYLDVVQQKANTKKWAFWSGIGAQDAAKKEVSGGVVLEGTVGKWFDEVWNFEKLTGGVKSIALWAALSEMYADRAAEYYNDFEFVGFVGPGATRDQSVFNKIEQPTVIEVFSKKAKVDAPTITWFVVDCAKDGEKWKWTGNKSQKFSSREAALGEVRSRYGN